MRLYDVINEGSLYIIAEAGINHNGDLQLAKEMVRKARKVGANAVKFQSFSVDKLITYRGLGKSLGESTHRFMEISQLLEGLSMSEQDHRELSRLCEELEVEFLSSPFDIDSADMLDRLGVEAFKIASGEMTNIAMLRHIAQKGKPLIVSTGMSNIAEIRTVIREIMALNDQIVLLHCISLYPTPLEKTNLRFITTLREKFPFPIGFSDHTIDTYAAVAAVALGASVIEKHFTLDRNLPGPDHICSLEPEELKEYIYVLRKVKEALKSEKRIITKGEIENRRLARKSLIAKEVIREGEKITQEKLEYRRPGVGINPLRMKDLIGKKAVRNIEAGSIINWEDLTNS